MKLETSIHLSEEALNDALIGLASMESQAHLARCPQCRAQVEEFHAGIDLFNEASLAWSEAQTGRTPKLAPWPVRPAHRRLVLAAWATAAVLFVIAGAPFLRHPIQQHTPALVPGAIDSEAQIAEDNELMRNVNAAINPDEQSVVSDYQLVETPPTAVYPKTRTE